MQHTPLLMHHIVHTRAPGTPSGALLTRLPRACRLVMLPRQVIRSNETMTKAAALEQRLLRLLAERDPDGRKHVVRLLRTFSYRNHVCMVFEPMVSTARRAAGTACCWPGLLAPAACMRETGTRRPCWRPAASARCKHAADMPAFFTFLSLLLHASSPPRTSRHAQDMNLRELTLKASQPRAAAPQLRALTHTCICAPVLLRRPHHCARCHRT